MILAPYVSQKERNPARLDFERDGDVIGNLYNEYYGKAGVNFPDVVRSVAEKRAVAILKKPLGEGRAKELAVEISQAVANEGYLQRFRELELAFDETYRRLSEPERASATHNGTMFQTFLATVGQMRREYERALVDAMAVKGVPAELRQELVAAVPEIMSQAMRKEYERTRRKIAEMRALLGVLDRYAGDLKDMSTFVDMAGGVGDLGVAIAETRATDGVRVRVVDVVPSFEQYAGYLKSVGLVSDTRDRVSFELHPLQETSIDDREHTAIVAKHPCGGLKDEVVDLAIRENVAFVMIMTCCQDKMCEHAEQFFPKYQSDAIPTIDEFRRLAKTSARTNIDPSEAHPERRLALEAKREEGVRAMLQLDQRTAERLREAGYDVDMFQIEDPLIHKGNVIVARKRKEKTA